MKYKFKFEASGLLLFALIMLPNIIWFIIPAPNDVLRAESATQVLDMVASAFQVIAVACLALIKNNESKKLGFSRGIAMSCMFVLCYYALWILYYVGFTYALIMLGLAILPCAAFVSYAIDRKNYVALLPLAVFTVCHTIFAYVNFVM